MKNKALIRPYYHMEVIRNRKGQGGEKLDHHMIGIELELYH